MAINKAEGRFVAYITNPVTGERIYAKSYGKKAFFLPSSSSGKKKVTPPYKGSSSSQVEVTPFQDCSHGETE